MRDLGQAGPPPQPTLPAVRRRLAAVLERLVRPCPLCHKPVAYHMRQ